MDPTTDLVALASAVAIFLGLFGLIRLCRRLEARR